MLCAFTATWMIGLCGFVGANIGLVYLKYEDRFVAKQECPILTSLHSDNVPRAPDWLIGHNVLNSRANKPLRCQIKQLAWQTRLTGLASC